MESKSTPRVMRRRMRPLPGTYRFYPYATGSGSGKEDMKEEVVRLGVKLSLSVAESMFLLCDDIRTMLWFCYKLWKYTIPPSDPVSQRLLRVIHHVYSKYIKQKNRVYHQDDDGNNNNNNNSIQWELISRNWRNFTDGVIVLHQLVFILRNKYYNCYDDRLLSTAITKYKQQVLKKLEDELRLAKDVSEANGFARETILKSNISEFWKSLFNAEVGEVTPEETRNKIIGDMFQPILGESSSHSEIKSLPVYSPYILGTDFAKEELKDEVVQLGAELSLYVAESMFLLCDDIRTMLRYFLKLWRFVERELPASYAGNKLLRAIHYVCSKHIKPKNGVHQIGGNPIQWELVMSAWVNFEDIIGDMHTLGLNLIVVGNCADGRELTNRVEEGLKNVKEKLSSAKDVSEANGFAKDYDAMKSNILELWKTLFDKETEESWYRQARTNEILYDLFKPLSKEAPANISYYY